MATESEQNIQNLWNTLKKRGYTPPELGKFADDMKDEGNLQRVWNTLKKEGYEPPEFDTFKADMGWSAPEHASVEALAPAPQPAAAPSTTPALTRLTYPTAPAPYLSNDRVQGLEMPAPIKEEPQTEDAVPPSAWRPTEQQRRQMASDLAEVGAGVERMQRSTDRFNRFMSQFTLEGRRKQREAKERARLLGADTSLIGIEGRLTAGAEAGGEPNKPTTLSPQVVDVTYDADGKAQPVWMLPDGSTTTSRMEANMAEGGARAARRAHERELEMKRRGYDPSKPEDVELADAEDRQAQLEEAMSRRKQELDAEKGSNKATSLLHDLAMSSRGGISAPNDDLDEYRTDKEYVQLEAALRKNSETLRRLKDKREGKTNDFWHAVGATMANGYTFSDGVSDLNDSRAQLLAQQRLDSINAKIEAGEPLTREEEVAKSTLDSFIANDRANAMVGEYGAWGRAGEMMANSVDFMKDIMLMPGAESMAKGIAKGVTSTLGKSATKVLGEKVAESTVAKGILKGTGILVGAHTTGAVISNTTGVGRTLAETSKNAADDISIDKKGRYSISQKDPGDDTSFMGMAMSAASELMPALVEAERTQTGENGSEMFGAFIPGLGGVAKSALSKIGLSKISNSLTKIGNKQWVKQYNSLLSAGGYNGLPGEALEEYEGMMFDALTGNAAETWENVKDINTHIDIWLGCATMGAILGAAPMAGQGLHLARYHRQKHKTDMAERLAATTLGADRWEQLRTQLDETDNGSMADAVFNIATDNSLNPEAKNAALGYARELTKMRGYNIADANNAEQEPSREVVEANNAYESARNVVDNYESALEAGDEAAQAQAQSDIDAIGLRVKEAYQGIEDAFGPDAELCFAEIEEVFGPNAQPYGDEQWAILGNPELTEDKQDAVLYYINSKAAMDGIADAALEGAERKKFEAQAEIKHRTHKGSGTIQPAVMKSDNRQVYVVMGNIKMHPDGTDIDRAGSDRQIFIFDPSTNKIESTAPEFIERLEPPIDPHVGLQTAYDEIEAEQDSIFNQEIFSAGQMIDSWHQLPPKALTPLQAITDAEGHADFTNADISNEERWRALVEAAHGNEENAARVVEAQAANAKNAIEALKRQEPKPNNVSISGVTDPNEMIRLLNQGNEAYQQQKAEYDTQLSALQQVVDMWENTAWEHRSKTQYNTRKQDDPTFDALAEDFAWDDLVKAADGKEADAVEIALAQIQQAKDNLEALKKKEPTPNKPKLKGSPAAMLKAKREAAEQYQLDMALYNDRIQSAQSTLNKWNRIIGVYNSRVTKRQRMLQEEHERMIAEAKAREEAERIAREEQARIEREALEGVPDLSVDKPADARARGYVRVGREKIDRQVPYERENNPAYGIQVSPMFSSGANPVTAKGRVLVAEAEDMQPSHLDGELNPRHFIPDAQPKARHQDGGVSLNTADRNARNINPSLVMRLDDAYAGAPVVNRYREGVQGNGRLQMLRLMYERYPEQAAAYKQALVNNADKFGLDPAYIASLNRPVMAMEIDADDATAIDLGMMTSTDMESGGIERIKPNHTVRKMGAEMGNFSRMLLRSENDEASLSDMLDTNAGEVLAWMNRKGFISDTQYASATQGGRVTNEAKEDLRKVIFQSIFDGAPTRLEEMFGNLPSKTQRAILATGYRDLESPDDSRIKDELQQAIIVYNMLRNDAMFDKAGNVADAMLAMSAWENQYIPDEVDPSKSILPVENFSNFALTLAAYFRGMSQKSLQQLFANLYDTIQGKKTDDLFGEADKSTHTLSEAIAEVLGIEYKPVTKTNNNEQDGSGHVGIDAQDGQAGQSGSPGGDSNAEPDTQTSGSAERGGRASGDSEGSAVTSSESGQELSPGPQTVEPTEAQKAAGNYKKEHRRIDGYNISIENAKGSVRSGKDADGEEWSITMHNDYGYIRGTEGVDGDHIDVFLSDTPEEGDVFVVDQVNKDGSFDEHKVMYGFPTEEAAREAYLSNYEEGWTGLGAITHVSKDEFKKWIASSHRKTKPFAEYKSIKPMGGESMPARLLTEQGVAEITSEERAEMEARIIDWLSDENLSKAFGKSRNEIFDEFGNDLMPIAYVPSKYISLLNPSLKDSRIYCGKGYFIDHALRNHGGADYQLAVEDVDVSKYLNIQNVLDNPDSIKETKTDGKRTVVFIKKIGRFFAELTQVEEGDKIVLHKSLFDQKKEPYAKLNDIRQEETSSEGGASSISHADDTAPAISLESRGDAISQKPASVSSTDIESEPEGKRNDTATPQNGLISGDKDNTLPSDKQAVEAESSDSAAMDSYSVSTSKESPAPREKGESASATGVAPANVSSAQPSQGDQADGIASNQETGDSESKDSALSTDDNAKTKGKTTAEAQDKIEDFGEKIAGARKDMLREFAKSMDNVTVQSLIELPLSKAFKRPNLKKMVESGVISDSDAALAEAIIQGMILSKKKPALTKRLRSKREIAEWAEETYKGIRMLSDILSGDESRKEGAIARHKEVQAEETKKANEHIAHLREWNPDKQFNDIEAVPDPIDIIRSILEGINHRPGEKVDLPLTRIDLCSNGRLYEVQSPGKQGSLWFKRYHNTSEDAIKTAVLAAKLARGDMDVELPETFMRIKGVGNPHKVQTGKFSVIFWGTRKNIEERTFDTEADAKAFAEKKQGRVRPEEKYINEYDAYTVVVTNPLTGDTYPVGSESASRDELVSWTTDNREDVNKLALEAIYGAMGTKGTPRPHFYVATTYDRDIKRSIYSVVEDDKNNPWPIVKDFADRSEAEAWLKDNIDRLEQERKEKRDAERKVVYFQNTNGKRHGADRRNGEPATPEMFDAAFGFRGVQFGNWTNGNDRQMALNQAYDAFMDMSEMLGLSPKAMSLDGELGLAFGARGSGSALAHYEPNEVVINLTKTRGAGSLAHEWLHALDNFLSRRNDVPLGHVTHGNGIDTLNPAVGAALADLMDAVKASYYNKRSLEKGDYWGRPTEVMARLFESWIADKFRQREESSPFLAVGLNPKAMEPYQFWNYLAYKANEYRRAKLKNEEPKVMSREEFNELPESLRGYPYPTQTELEQLSPYLDAFFKALSEREGSSGSMAEERGRRYGKSKVMTGRSLFDWREEVERAVATKQDPDEDSAASEQANNAIDRYATSYNVYLDRTIELEELLGSSPEEDEAIREQIEHEEALFLEAREQLQEELRQFFVRNNTPEDAEKIARDMTARTQFEVEIQRNKRQQLQDILLVPEQKETVEQTEATDNVIKTAGGEIRYNAIGHLPDAATGEFAYVERKFSRSGEFDFTGSEAIRDRGDVAYMFRALQDYSIENVFAAFVKDGKVKVMHIGMGGPTASFANLGAVRAGYDAFGADKIYLVHNHPSGNLNPSSADQGLMQRLEDAFKDMTGMKVEGLIIDTTSGRYASFYSRGSAKQIEMPESGGKTSPEVYRFDKISRDANIKDADVIRNPSDVVDFIKSQRFDNKDKISYMVLTNSNQIVGNFHSGYSDIRDESLAEEIASVATKFGGTKVVVYGNADIKKAATLKSRISEQSLNGVILMDAVESKNDINLSAFDAGYINEEAETYGANETTDSADASSSAISAEDNGDAGLRFREVTDKDTLKRLENEPTVKVYRAMQLIDGKLYPPMSAKSGGKLREPMRLGRWQESEEHPEMADENGLFLLDKGNGKSLKAAYNPYIHTSRSMLNDQFSEASNRPNLVVVEVEVPMSELTSGYRAEKAKDTVGEMDWHSGPVSSKLPEGKKRKVILTRWAKTMRIIPDAEVAANVAEMLDKEGIVIPSNTITPGLRAELEKLGVPIMETDTRGRVLDMEGAIKAQAEAIGRQTGEKIRVITAEEAAKMSAGRRRRAKGWYDTITGNVVIVASNHETVSDAINTLYHEIIGHKGLRELIGDSHFNDMLDWVYDNAPKKLREAIDNRINAMRNARIEEGRKNGSIAEAEAYVAVRNDAEAIRREATEEELANRAGEMGMKGKFREMDARERGFWETLRERLLNMLNKVLGRETWGKNVKLSMRDIDYLLFRSWEAKRGRGGIFDQALDMAKRDATGYNMMDPAPNVRFRDGDYTQRDPLLAPFAKSAYDSIVASSSFQMREAMQDSMLGLKVLVAQILGAPRDFRIEDVDGYENAYLYENRMSSTNRAQATEYQTKFFKPIEQAVMEIAGADEAKQRELKTYMKAKHGLERNTYMRSRSIAYGDRDFAGLIGLMTPPGSIKPLTWSQAEAEAQKLVDEYEKLHDTKELWDAVYVATQETLRRVYASGLMSAKRYDRTRQMYQFYIPLQGFEDTTSDEVYAYLTDDSYSGLPGEPVKKAKGRTTRSNDPLAAIASMAEAAINQGNRNIFKRHFYNFVHNHPNRLVSIDDLWLEYDDVGQTWRPVFADTLPTDSAEDVERKIRAFNERMEQLQRANPDKYKTTAEDPDIPYRVMPENMREHQVIVKRNGRTYVMTINGNPRAAQALNGLTNPDVDVNGAIGEIFRGAERINRLQSVLYTTLSPAFAASNFVRDLLYTNSMVHVKENGAYALRFHRNYGLYLGQMYKLLKKWEKGALDPNNATEKLFLDFMRNGGETGFTSNRDIEDHKKEIAADLKAMDSKIRNGLSALGRSMDLLNRTAENAARFAAFVTSRESGRSIDRAIWDAKEISVNFNKKGSGGTMLGAKGQTRAGRWAARISGSGRAMYIFWNASVQALNNIATYSWRNKRKAIGLASTLFAMGATLPLAATLLGPDDDDDNYYYNIPDYVRRTNICIWVGKGWVKIPLPPEFRAIYGMGELAMSVCSGVEGGDAWDLAQKIASQMSQVLPVDFMEGTSSLVPSMVKPLYEVGENKSFSGVPIYRNGIGSENRPEWRNAYRSTGKWYVEASKWLNEATGGDDYAKGWADINPAKVEHILKGYLGGPYSMTMQLANTLSKAVDGEFNPNATPIVNRFFTSVDDRTANRKLFEDYYDYSDEYEETRNLVSKYEAEARKGSDKYREKSEQLHKEPRYARYEIMEYAGKEIERLEDAIASSIDAEGRPELEQMRIGKLRELVEGLNDTRSYAESHGNLPHAAAVHKSVSAALEEIAPLKRSDPQAYRERYRKITSGENGRIYRAYHRHKLRVDAAGRQISSSSTPEERQQAAFKIARSQDKLISDLQGIEYNK